MRPDAVARAGVRNAWRHFVSVGGNAARGGAARGSRRARANVRGELATVVVLVVVVVVVVAGSLRRARGGERE
jgi:signal transduction histidine kinase